MADIAPPENPIEALLRIGAGLWQSRALWAAARLRIADAIGDAPASVEEIAGKTGPGPTCSSACSTPSPRSASSPAARTDLRP